ncbi:MAG TPA: hypothetical protein VKA63_12165, partial [Candidatus Krumholzibacteria bacterium]|nr:hypothetical protein [Candidatus Krumholzibacteria bacterium]
MALIDCVIWAGMNIIVFSSIGFDWFMAVGSTMTAIVILGFALPSSTSADPQIRFDGHWLEQVAGGKVQAENPVENLEKVMIGGLIFALTLKFGAGVRMSLMQIPRSECYRLAHDLRQAPGARLR